MTSNEIIQGLLLTLMSLWVLPGGLWVHAQNNIPKIGIIGGGIGGTSCAYFLKSLFEGSAVDVRIDVFEAERVGGRLALVDISGRDYELGGSIIHSRNKYMVEFLRKFRLKTRRHDHGYFALYDGKEFVFSESEWQLLTLWKVVYRYGYGFWKLRSHIEDMLTKFDRIYKLQNNGVTYTTVGSMLAAMDPNFVEYLQMTTKFGFEREGISKVVVDEIIMATTRTNYGQALNIHKMVGSVSTAGVIGSMWAVHGGNVQIPEHLLKASRAKLINLTVTSVEKTPEGRFCIKTGGSDQDGCAHLYDVVIVAAPQTHDSKYSIKFKGFREEIKFPGRYHKTVCTILEGCLSDDYFPDKDPIIDEILTTTEDVSFNSIGRITPVDYTPGKDRKSNVWKIFTQEKMHDRLLGQIFSEVKKKHVKEWLAYPHYDHSFRNDSFVLAPNLYHINAIEWAASAMEMSVIGARNVALLASKRFLAGWEDETTGGYPRQESTTGCPQYETTSEYLRQESTTGRPQFETTSEYPRQESTAGCPQFETTSEYPRQESTAGCPQFETTSEYPRQESTAGCPQFETTSEYPRQESTAGCPQFETTSEYPRQESTAGCPQFETTSEYPRQESTAGCPQFETTSEYPRQESTAGCPQFETTSEYPRQESTAGCPQFETTSEYPRQESTAGCPQYQTTSPQPQYESTTVKSGVWGEKEEL